MTSTATLQAALDVMNNKEPSIGYSIAYPFGVIGPILCIYFMTRVVQPKFPAKAQRFHMGEISIGDKFSGRRLDELTKDLPEGVQVTMVRQSGQNVIPAPDLALSPGDAVMIIAERQDAIGEAAARLGKLEPGRLAKDRARSRLHPRFRRQSRRGRRAPRPPSDACRLSGPYPAREAV